MPLRRRLAEREAARRLADWLGRRAQLGRHVFARGAPDPALDAAPAAGDLAELLRACLRLLEPSVRDRVCRSRPPPLWRAPDALARMRALLPALPPGGAPLGRFLPAAAEAGDAPLQRRAALAGTLAAGLKLAREGALALEQAGGFGKVRVRPPPPPPRPPLRPWRRLPSLRAMTIVLREPWTVERFLSWEDGQEGRHEFDGTRILAMTGGSRAHQRIVHNLIRLLEDRLDPARFDAVAEMRVEVDGKVRYPDVCVCAGRIPDAARTLRDAVVVVEVLSADTAEADRGEKRGDYARLPGLRRYVLVEQDRAAAAVLERTAAGWAEAEVAGMGGAVALPEVGVELPLAEVYRGVSLPPDRARPGPAGG